MEFASDLLPVRWTYDDWFSAGLALGRARDRLQWQIGDWWIAGEERGYGERLKALLGDDWEGPAYQTIRNAAWVCRKFPPSRRRDSLTFTHHAEVAKLGAAAGEYLLWWAEREHASVRQLRARKELEKGRARDLAGQHQRAVAGVTGTEEPPTNVVPLSLPPDPDRDACRMVSEAVQRAYKLPNLSAETCVKLSTIDAILNTDWVDMSEIARDVIRTVTGR